MNLTPVPVPDEHPRSAGYYRTQSVVEMRLRLDDLVDNRRLGRPLRAARWSTFITFRTTPLKRSVVVRRRGCLSHESGARYGCVSASHDATCSSLGTLLSRERRATTRPSSSSPKPQDFQPFQAAVHPPGGCKAWRSILRQKRGLHAGEGVHPLQQDAALAENDEAGACAVWRLCTPSLPVYNSTHHQQNQWEI